jgi:preprotein translocase subunit SecD
VLDVARVLGQEVASASAQQVPPDSQWVIYQTFNSAGTSALSTLTTLMYNRYYDGTNTGNLNDEVLDEVGLVFDGTVVAAPDISAPITDGISEISGQFTRASAEELAAQLQGPLPVTFRIVATRISP